ncbi:MAG: hypothetical protein JWN04_3373 [Myxococcaceae bacterium]|nr:hypothetical protein [Myxococcaceae bacterium]
MAPRLSTVRRLWLLARICFPLLVFAYLFRRLDGETMRASVARITFVGALGCLAGQAAAIATGLVRWRLLMRAYGAEALPSWLDSARLFLIGAFYNLLPGAVGGDLVRAYAVRAHFENASVTQSIGVVFVERVLGLSALLALSAASATLSPSLSGPVLAYALIGLLGSVAAITAVAAARRIASVLPPRLARFFASFPTLRFPSALMLAALVSVATHLSIALGGYVLIRDLAPQVSLTDALVSFPLGTLAAYFPATVAGAGARDVALVVLFERVGVARADALTTSIAMLAANITVSGIGGLLHAFWPPPVIAMPVADEPSAPHA